MPIELIRRPRSPRRLHSVVRGEVRNSYNLLGDVIIKRLESDIQDWEHQPEFEKKVVVGTKTWSVRVRLADPDSEAGEIYNWVDKGTGSKVDGGESYEIFPVVADALSFTVPDLPKTVASSLSGSALPGGLPGIVLDANIDTNDVLTKKVTHPGITPREFTKSLNEFLKSKTPGAFVPVTEAAIKRAFRKIGIYA